MWYRLISFFQENDSSKFISVLEYQIVFFEYTVHSSAINIQYFNIQHGCFLACALFLLLVHHP